MTFQEINDSQGKIMQIKGQKWERKGSESEMGIEKNHRRLKNVLSKA